MFLRKTVEIHFTYPATDEAKEELKPHGFRWDHRRMAWVADATPEVEAFASDFVARHCNEREEYLRGGKRP
jgi:hypothetical protein